MNDEQNKQEKGDTEANANARRDFLRKSIYVAYATPVIMSLLVERADALTSWTGGDGSGPPPPPPGFVPPGGE